MDKALVVYWSGTGNTEAMAKAIGKGLRDAGAEADVVSVSAIAPADALAYTKIAFGCPSMGDEVLEEAEFEPFFTETESGLDGKKVGLFGSYGWGDGQWMREWRERCEKTGATMAAEDLIENEAPDEANCEAWGRSFAAL